MALTKNTLASSTYIVTTGSTTVNYVPATRADVDSTVFPITITTSATLTAPAQAGLVSSTHVTKPGVFTVGTAPEGTLSNPTNDSNN